MSPRTSPERRRGWSATAGRTPGGAAELRTVHAGPRPSFARMRSVRRCGRFSRSTRSRGRRQPVRPGRGAIDALGQVGPLRRSARVAGVVDGCYAAGCPLRETRPPTQRGLRPLDSRFCADAIAPQWCRGLITSRHRCRHVLAVLMSAEREPRTPCCRRSLARAGEATPRNDESRLDAGFVWRRSPGRSARNGGRPGVDASPCTGSSEARGGWISAFFGREHE
jgi:hypothetical protein